MSDAALTTVEQADLARLEDRIRAGLDSFMDVGGALAEIAQRDLHRATHATFADYCRDVWEIGPSRAYQLIGAAEVVQAISTKVETPPKRAAQAQALLAAPPEHRADAWKDAQAEGGPQPKAKVVKSAADKYVPAAERKARYEKRQQSKVDADRALREAEFERREEEAKRSVAVPAPKGVTEEPAWKPTLPVGGGGQPGTVAPAPAAKAAPDVAELVTWAVGLPQIPDLAHETPQKTLETVVGALNPRSKQNIREAHRLLGKIVLQLDIQAQNAPKSEAA